jgi:hypothetical protein
MISTADADADVDLLWEKNTAEWLADKLKRTGRKMEPTVNSGEAHIADDSSVRTRYAL